MHRKIGGQGHLKSTLTGQTDSVFSRNPDRIRISDRIEIGRIQTYRRTGKPLLLISGQRTLLRQIESGVRMQIFWIPDRHPVENPYRSGHVRGQQSNTGQDFSENPDKNETQKGHR